MVFEPKLCNFPVIEDKFLDNGNLLDDFGVDGSFIGRK
jgi:hypothetical protein